MNIIVCVKIVVNKNGSKYGKRQDILKRKENDSKLNEADKSALLQAKMIKQKYGGTITVLSMGPIGYRYLLKEAYFYLADRVILLSDEDFAGSDTLITSYILSKSIEKLGRFDMVLCGSSSSDGGTGQVGPSLAQWLRIPHLLNVETTVSLDDENLTCTREMGDYKETIRLQMPCLLVICKKKVREYKDLRLFPALRDMEVTIWSNEVLTIEKRYCGIKGSPTKVLSIFEPEFKKETLLLDGSKKEDRLKLYQVMKPLL